MFRGKFISSGNTQPLFSYHIWLDPKPNPVVADIEAHEEVDREEKRQSQLQDPVCGGFYHLRASGEEREGPAFKRTYQK
jgi:hypothetical protein